MNVNIPAFTEREQFSARLKQALGTVGASPTKLQREFNRAYDGQPITVHAARKWLVGEAIPTQEKIRILAKLTGSTMDWLRFGVEGGPASDMNLAGSIVEVGDLDGEGGARGIVIKRPDGTFVTVKGLTEDEARALAPHYMDEISLQVIASGVPV